MSSSTVVLFICLPVAVFVAGVACLVIAASMLSSQISQAEEKYKGMEN